MKKDTKITIGVISLLCVVFLVGAMCELATEKSLKNQMVVAQPKPLEKIFVFIKDMNKKSELYNESYWTIAPVVKKNGCMWLLDFGNNGCSWFNMETACWKPMLEETQPR